MNTTMVLNGEDLIDKKFTQMVLDEEEPADREFAQMILNSIHLGVREITHYMDVVRIPGYYNHYNPDDYIDFWRGLYYVAGKGYKMADLKPGQKIETALMTYTFIGRYKNQNKFLFMDERGKHRVFRNAMSLGVGMAREIFEVYPQKEV